MKIAVVTFEFPKLTKNGGIGTAYGRLVDLLAKDGHHVSVYYVDITGVTSRFLNHGKTFFQLDSEKVRIKFIAPKVGGLANGTSWALERSIAVLKELEESKYDTIHFHDCLGLGWAYAKLHKFGLVGRRTNVVLGMHGPNFWVRDAHRKPTADLNEILETQLEKELYQDAQEVVSPSKYMLDYLAKSGCDRDQKHTRVIPNVTHFESVPNLPVRKTQSPNKLVFFGRLESRKGVSLFVEALLLFSKKHKLVKGRKLSIVFLGRDTELPSGEMASAWIKAKLERTGHFNLTFHTQFDSQMCEKYFSENPRSLVVMPSLADNSPYAVVEALEQRLNFVSTNVGGQAELLDQTNGLCTVDPDPRKLAEMLLGKFTSNDQSMPIPSEAVLNANSRWLQFHCELKASQKNTSVKNLQGRLAVLIKSSGNFYELNRTLQSIFSQNVKIDSVDVHLHQSHFKNPESVQVMAHLSKLYQTLNVRVLLHFGGWHDEMFFKTQRDSSAEFLFPIIEGDTVQRDFFKQLCSILSSSHQQAEAYVFGFSSKGSAAFCPPLNFENHFLFDFFCKYPSIIKRQQNFEKKMTDNFIMSHFFTLRTEHLFRLVFSQERVESIPIIALNNDLRDFYHPLWVIKDQDFQRRLRVMPSHMNDQTKIVLENFYRKLNQSRWN